MQSVCRVTIVEKCSLEQHRKNAEIVWQWKKKNVIGYEKRAFLSSPMTRTRERAASRRLIGH